MIILEWSEQAYATGFETIDRQHRKLFDFINELGSHIETGQAPDEIEVYLAFLGDYIKNHFGQEENCMAAVHCPFAAENCAAHDKFVKAYEGFHQRFRSGEKPMKLAAEMHTMLSHWTVQHIRRVDSHLRKCATNRMLADAGS